MNVTILGCGAYGNALGLTFLNNNNSVTIWSKFQNEVDEFSSKYKNINYTINLEKSIRKSDLIIIAIPVEFFSDTVMELKNYYDNQDIVVASKGIDVNSYFFAYEIIINILGDIPIGVISGGSFAIDMANKKVLGLTLGTKYDRIRDKIKNSLECSFVKIQYNSDILGVSVCGAIKNVIAIGCGILDGAGYPESTKFLFLTESMYEIKYIIHSLGGSASTILSYAGIDDIMMTCTSDKSRNYTFGKMIGNNSSNDLIDEYKKNTTIEGLGSSMAIYKLIKKKKIYAPICTTIYQILYENKRFNSIIKYLEKKES